ncbi:ABC transporter permease [Georgenia sp. H159]|uniref:ABC transporter permease n=1 Tax=Georgenia sp. H159 TaxID=3076115 RepID=UPI002D7658EC|nr:ABC transporter permease [Georgenia sp. H159]
MTTTPTASGSPGVQDPAAPAGEVPLTQASLMVAEREIVTQVRTKSFIISLVVTLVIVLAGIVVSAVLADREDSGTRVAVVGGAVQEVSGAKALEPVTAPDVTAAEELVRSGDVEAAVVPDAGSPVGLRVIALSDAPSDVVAALSVSPPVDLLDTSTSDDLRYLVSFGFGLVFMMFAMGSGAMIVQNTVQEKQSRIVEILLSAVPARALLAGKVLGNSVLAVGQTAAIAAVAVLGLLLTGQGDLLDLLTAPIVWFVVFFLFGFVLVAALFAAGASLVSRQEDTGSVMMPTMMLVMLPYFVVIFLGDSRLAMTIASYVPFSAPVAMPVRMFMGEAQWWEPLLSLGLLAAAAIVVVALAARIYSRALLRTGSRVPLRQALARD